MNNDWIKVYACGDAMKSDLVKQILIENEIEAVTLDKKGYPYQFGEVEVYVHPENADRAKAIVLESEL